MTVGALVILKGAGDDLGGRGRAAIDQHDHRLAGQRSPASASWRWVSLGIAAARRHDLAAIEEGVGNRDRLIEQAARIVAQVDDVALQIGACLGLDRAQGGVEAFLRLLAEGGDADIADVVALELGLHRLHTDQVANELDLEGFLAPWRIRVRVIGVLTLPRILSTACSRVRP